MKYHAFWKRRILDKKLDDMRFDFYGKFLQGQKRTTCHEQTWTLEVVNGILGEIFSKLYVKNISQKQKKKW